MKKTIISAFVAIATTFAVSAQNIAVVSESGGTEIYQSLDDAISGATDGAVIYLPGGGFQVKDETKITHRVTIVGVSYRVDADNADGGTTIAGNLWFEKGADGTAIMGIYLSGNVNIGTSDSSVDNVLIRYCDVNSVKVYNGTCSGIITNQCYLRNNSNYGGTNAKVTNSVVHSIQGINGGLIDHNVVRYHDGNYALRAENTIISNCFLLSRGYYGHHTGGNCIFNNNCIGSQEWGENSATIESWDDVFSNYSSGVSPYADYHVLCEECKNAGTDGTDIGIYGGTGFNENKSMVPIPRIVSKTIPEQTDGSGNLSIKITVKAN